MVLKAREDKTKLVVEKSTHLVYSILQHTPVLPLDSLLDPYVYKVSVNTWRTQVIQSIRYFTLLYISGLVPEQDYLDFIRTIECELEKVAFTRHQTGASKCFFYMSCMKRRWRLSCSLRSFIDA